MSLHEELLTGERRAQTQPCQEISDISCRQLNRSQRECLLRSRRYCLDTLEWGGVVFAAPENFLAAWELSSGDPSRMECFSLERIAFQGLPAIFLRTLLLLSYVLQCCYFLC